MDKILNGRVELPTHKGDKGDQGEKGEKGEKGERGNSFRFEDFTPEQLQSIKGADGVTPIKGTHYFDGINGKNGVDGKSSYAYAVSGGYLGTEAQFGAEQSTIANNSARLTAVESNKADLGTDRYVPLEQIHPLQGKQTGYIHTGSTGTYGSATMITPAASLTYELLMDTVQIEHPTGMIVLNTSGINTTTGRSIYLYQNQIFVWYNNASTYVSFNVSPLKDGITHLVVTYDYENKVISILLNGQFYTKSVQNLIIEQTTGFYLARTTYNTNSPTYQNRIFNKVLSVHEMLSLWNNGNPQNYRWIDKTSLVAEYIPEYLSQERWLDASGNNNHLTRQGTVALTYGYNSNNGHYKESTLTPLFVARGAVFNAQTGYYELNGLTDITEAQMVEIYNTSAGILGGNWESAFYRSNCRTNFYQLRLNSRYSATECFRETLKMEVVKLSSYIGSSSIMGYLTNGYLMFHQSGVSMILDSIDCRYLTEATMMFNYCSKLTKVQLYQLEISISFTSSPFLERDSILYIANNRTKTNPITVMLHAEAVARLTPEDIALLSSKNITIA